MKSRVAEMDQYYIEGMTGGSQYFSVYVMQERWNKKLKWNTPTTPFPQVVTFLESLVTNPSTIVLHPIGTNQVVHVLQCR